MSPTTLGCLLGLLMTVHASGATFLQQEAGVLAFEAENYSSLTGSNWSVITTDSGLKTLPEGTNAVGDALYNHSGGNLNSYATYELQFTHDGEYFLYTRYSMYDRTTPANGSASYGNEDSFFLPESFNQDAVPGVPSGTGWYVQTLSSRGYNPESNPNEGMYFLWDQAQKGAGSSDPVHSYVISGASAENPVTVTFTISNRENGVALDRFVFSTSQYSTSTGLNSSLDAIASVPEPSRALLTCLALGAVFIRRRRR